MKIVVHVYVKFRVLGITLGTVDKVFEEPLPEIPVNIPPRNLVKFTSSGVLITVDLVAK